MRGGNFAPLPFRTNTVLLVRSLHTLMYKSKIRTRRPAPGHSLAWQLFQTSKRLLLGIFRSYKLKPDVRSPYGMFQGYTVQRHSLAWQRIYVMPFLV